MTPVCNFKELDYWKNALKFASFQIGLVELPLVTTNLLPGVR